MTLLSNSGGSRIARTYLAYAQASGSPSLQLVDMVVSLEGVQSGTYVAAIAAGFDRALESDPDAVMVRDSILDQIKPIIKHDPRRPLFQDVTPRSDNITYTDQTVQIPSGPSYVNVDGDIRIHIIESLFLIPVQPSRTYSIGDGVILPGSDDPRDLPQTGGGRFLPSVAGRGASSDEWELTRDFNVNFDPLGFVPLVSIWEMSDVLAAPELHVNLGRDLDHMRVRYYGTRHLDEVIFDQIAALDSGLRPAPGSLGLGHRSEVPCP